MTDTAQIQSKHGKTSERATAALAGTLGVLLIVLSATSHFNLVSEQITIVLSLGLIGVAIVTFWNWTRNYKTSKA